MIRLLGFAKRGTQGLDAVDQQTDHSEGCPVLLDIYVCFYQSGRCGSGAHTTVLTEAERERKERKSEREGVETREQGRALPE